MPRYVLQSLRMRSNQGTPKLGFRWRLKYHYSPMAMSAFLIDVFYETGSYRRIIACYENLDAVSLRPDFCRSNHDS